MNTLLQAQLSHKICSFKGRGMILIFTGFVFFLHYRRKRQQCRLMGGTERKEGKEKKVTLAAKCPRF